MDKYYLKVSTDSRQCNLIIRNNPDLEVSLHEDVDTPYFNLLIFKLGQKRLKRLSSNKYEKFKEIAPETYASYYQLALKSFQRSEWNQAEYYYIEKSSTWTDIIMFTGDPKINSVFLYIAQLTGSLGKIKSGESQPLFDIPALVELTRTGANRFMEDLMKLK